MRDEEYSRRHARRLSVRAMESTAVAINGNNQVLQGDGNAIAVVVSALWTGIIGTDTTVIIRAGSGPGAHVLAVLNQEERTAVLRYSDYGDLVRGPLFAEALVTAAAIRAFSVRELPPEV